MTNEELAKHWNVSLDEVKSITEFMNKNYFLTVGKNKTSGLYHGLLFRVEEDRCRLAVSTNQGFETADEAAKFMNDKFDDLEMPEGRAELLGVPVDAYKVLKKIEIDNEGTKNECQQKGIAPSANQIISQSTR